MIEESVEMGAKLWVPEYDAPELWHKENSRHGDRGVVQGDIVIGRAVIVHIVILIRRV